jgi:menaquinone-9 beta-reductase
MKGHSYYLFDPAHLDGAARVDADGRGGAYLAGDALGLAQPLTAEGILPATLSGRVLAEAILDGSPAEYPRRLRAHPVLADYARVFRLRELGSARARNGAGAHPPVRLPGRRVLARTGRRAVAHGFAWMFSGARLPAPRLVDLVLRSLERRGGTHA